MGGSQSPAFPSWPIFGPTFLLDGALRQHSCRISEPFPGHACPCRGKASEIREAPGQTLGLAVRTNRTCCAKGHSLLARGYQTASLGADFGPRRQPVPKRNPVNTPC